MIARLEQLLAVLELAFGGLKLLGRLWWSGSLLRGELLVDILDQRQHLLANVGFLLGDRTAPLQEAPRKGRRSPRVAT